MSKKIEDGCLARPNDVFQHDFRIDEAPTQRIGPSLATMTTGGCKCQCSCCQNPTPLASCRRMDVDAGLVDSTSITHNISCTHLGNYSRQREESEWREVLEEGLLATVPRLRQCQPRRFFVELTREEPKEAVPFALSSAVHEEGVFVRSSPVLPPVRAGCQEQAVVDEGEIVLTTERSRQRLVVSLLPQDRLGEGRYSAVFKGRLESEKATVWVAVKFARGDQDSTEAARREALALRSLAAEDGHVLHLFDTVAADGGLGRMPFSTALALVLEYTAIGTLHSLLAQGSLVLTRDLFFRWGSELFSALATLRLNRIIHHDLKLHNILLVSGLSLRIADFGGCRIVAPDLDGLPVAESRGLGTMPYVAPELLTASPKPTDFYSYAVDCYSAGVVMYSLLTGREPFQDVPSQPVKMVLAARQGFFTAGHNPIPLSPDGSIALGGTGDRISAGELEAVVKMLCACTSKTPHTRPDPAQVARFFQTQTLNLI